MKELLARRGAEGLRRELIPVIPVEGDRILSNGDILIDFSGNDYLGLAGHPRLAAAAVAALDKWGTSSSASRLMSGDLEIFHQLEDAVSRFREKESALIFNSGYQANIGVISSLIDRGDVIFSDHLSHASIIDGILLARAAHFRFRHNDVGHLEYLLERERKKFKKALIVTETIFSMEGDRAPLKEIAALKEKHDCMLMADEAHATGIFGSKGAGIVEEEGLIEEVDLIMGTFGKALGSFGAYCATARTVVEYLVNTCRSFIYSTALPPPVIAVNLAALEVVRDEPHRRRQLLENAGHFRAQLRSKGLEVRGSSQIVPLITGDNQSALDLSEQLCGQGFRASAVRPPTVPVNESRIRFSLSFKHSRECLDELIEAIFEITGV